MVVAAGVDAAGNLDAEVADLLLPRGIGEMLRQFLRDRDRTGGCQRAIVEAGAAQDVGDEPDIALGQIVRAQKRENFRDVIEPHMRQDDVLHVA